MFDDFALFTDEIDSVHIIIRPEILGESAVMAQSRDLLSPTGFLYLYQTPILKVHVTEVNKDAGEYVVDLIL